ncbi:hypothetical protein [Persicirhabdus sediminis]|uniref:HEAT repeat-containing protein n=1 Tax=Persicirhabdus sediminis TaxID=454144 RepID=A0A8J7MEM5_9BACT|nr:hypothetical protein [Persicirhabdus sediminis]MBK1791266.1 hypothetical protein [Persicirhabdus sediminis]
MIIECPKCKQQFDGTEDLVGKTVECGACDHRFKIKRPEEEADKKVKLYPGEKKAGLERFGRGQTVAAPVNFQTTNYAADVNVSQVGPSSLKHTLMFLTGWGMIILVIVWYVIAHSMGAISDMTNEQRWTFLAFIALLGGGLVVAGSYRRRLIGLICVALTAFAMLALPIVMPANETVVVDTSDFDREIVEREIQLSEDDKMQKYKYEIGYEPVEAAVKNAKVPNSVSAVYMRQVGKYADVIEGYIFSKTGENDRPIIYPRGTGDRDGLMVILQPGITMDDLVDMCSTYGRILEVHEDLRLVDMIVNQSTLRDANRSQLIDVNHPEFYRQNLAALGSLDKLAVMQAIKRLALAPPIRFRDEIRVELNNLLEHPDDDIKVEAINALTQWANEGTNTDMLVMDACRGLIERGKMTSTCMAYLTKHQVNGRQEMLVHLWTQSPVDWQDEMKELGIVAEPELLNVIDQLDDLHLISAATILKSIGTAASLPHLQELVEIKEGHVQKTLQDAIDVIQKRL